MANESELEYWLRKGYRGADLVSFWEHSTAEDAFVLCRWDENCNLLTHSHRTELSAFTKVAIAFFVDALRFVRPNPGHFIFCAHDAMWSERSVDVPIFAFSKQIADRFTMLIPDAHYLAEEGYVRSLPKLAWMNQQLPWEERKPTAFWRGTSTGAPLLTKESWRKNPRVKLCSYAKEINDPTLLQATLSRILQSSDPAVTEQILAAGLVTAPIEFIDFSVFRYQINIDGNSTSWSMFLKLYMDSLVLKVDGLLWIDTIARSSRGSTTFR